MLFNQVQAKAPPKKTFLEIVSWRKKKKQKPRLQFTSFYFIFFHWFWATCKLFPICMKLRRWLVRRFLEPKKSREGVVCLRKKWSSGDQMLWIWFCCWGCKGKGVFSPYHHILIFIYFYFILFYFILFFFYYTWYTNGRETRNDGTTPRSVKLD